ncbi:C13 family peptidase [Nitrosomonas aestuarii]|uniref:C13 family peptidase n=1 Tax=Nitrosomonas aestuarii TaxID=52441 RepID=UPI000D2FCDD4|nr:C13 family peptidase [Nitrosomonas aestuarii]PTN10006.1 peptidase C13-like protein [Nitrosomonas aestuarii]
MRMFEQKSIAITVACLVCFIVLVFSSNTSRSEGISLNDAADKVINEIFSGELGERAMFAAPESKQAGDEIIADFSGARVDVTTDSWFFFIDEQPAAGWEHPAQYIFVDIVTGAIRTNSLTAPPQELSSLIPINAVAQAQLVIIDQNAISVEDVPATNPIITIPVKKNYAVLVSGGFNAFNNYSRYWNDIAFIYRALKDKYNFDDEEIIVLFANGTHLPTADLDDDGRDDIDFAATKANLANVLNQVAGNMDGTGKFFFYSTNHGGQESGQDAKLYLWGESIRDDELADLIKNIRAKQSIYTMEQCYSGGMMDDILAATMETGTSACVMTAANFDEVSYAADTEGNYDEYVFHWTSAVYGKDPDNNPVNADMNGDGRVTMREAHEYARTMDSASETPQIGESIVGACDAVLFNKPASIKSSGVWRSNDVVFPGWETVAFSDDNWPFARSPYPSSAHPTDLVPGTNASFMWHDPAATSDGTKGSDVAFFRFSFNLDLRPGTVLSAGAGTARISADDDYEFYVNGQLVFENKDNGFADKVDTVDFSSHLQDGQNVFAIHAVDGGWGSPFDRLYERVLFDAAILLPGDLNKDLCVDRSDLAILLTEIRKSLPHNLTYDLNADGIVNIADARKLVTLFTHDRGAACGQ